jgi:hypothetical protein
MSQLANDLFLESFRASTFWGNDELAVEGLEAAKELYETEGDQAGADKCQEEIDNIKAA